MARHFLTNVVLQLRATASVQQELELTDGELLERYLHGRDDDAFEALVERHGPMVLAVCRRVVGNLQDAEDAFQATFLVLVRKAASIRPRNKVGNWLHGVAYRAGLKARTLSNRQKERERQMKKVPEATTIETGLWEDLIPLLDQEINALPEKFRLPIVLCDLEGKSRKEAARHLNWPEGTVAGRLAQARTMLAKRLVKRGLPISGGVLAALFAQKAAEAAVPAALSISTVKAASFALLATGGAATGKVAAIADGVLKTMLISKLKASVLVVLAMAMLVLGGTFLAQVVAESTNEQQRADRLPNEKDANRNPSRLEGTWRRVSVELHGNKNVRYKNYEPFVIIEAGKLTTTDFLDQIERTGDIKIDSKQSAIDWLITDGPGKRTELLLSYELDGDTLRLAWDESTGTRPKEMTTRSDSTYAIFTYHREPPPKPTGAQTLEGAWNVVAHQTLGKAASQEFLDRKHQWIFAGKSLTMRDKDGISRTGTFRLDSSSRPRSMDLAMISGRPPGPRGAPTAEEEKSQCIYVIKDDVLTICYGDPGETRPKWFLSTFNLKTSVVTLKREPVHAVLPDRKLESNPGIVAIPTLEELGGLWQLNGNGFVGDLVLDVNSGKIDGRMYTQGITGAYDAKAGRIVLNRFDRVPANQGHIVQIYTGDVVRGDPQGPAYFLKGTFHAVGGANWGAEGVEYQWKAVRHCDHVKTLSIGTIMQAAHLTPGNRSTKNNLDNKLIDGKATKLEQQQLLDLYEELARRNPPRGDVKAWRERTSEMAAAVRAVIDGEKQAPERLAKARDCKACHDVHRQASLPDKSAPGAVAEVGGMFKPGSKMPKLVVDFVAGPKAGGSGCPSVMIANTRKPGIIVWCPSGGDGIFELTAALDRLVDGKKTQGYLVVFSSSGKGSLPGKAGRFDVENFQVGVPRGAADQRYQFERAVDGPADAIVFVVDAEEIRGAWPVSLATLGRDRVSTIVTEVSLALSARAPN